MKWLGALLAIVILSSSFYFIYDSQVRIDFTETRTFFKVKENSIFVIQGIEYTRIFDGTKLMRAKNRSLEVIYNKETTNAIREAYFKEGIVATDTYSFNNDVRNVENVPVSKETCFYNARGKIFEYLISNIDYNQPTKKISSPFSFAKKMLVEFEDGYHIAKVVNNKFAPDKIVIRYRITSDLECFDVRLSDPTGNLRLYLDDINSTRKYEFGTNVTFTVNYTTGATTLVCLDIDDNVNNLPERRNYTCQTTPYSVTYQIATLREDKFNDSLSEKEISNLDRVGIRLDSRVDLDNIQFNLSGNPASDVYINTTEIAVIIPGELVKNSEHTPEFIASGVTYSIHNLSFASAESVTINLNVSAQGDFVNRKGFFNFTISGYDLDAQNEFDKLQEFNVLKDLPIGNVTIQTSEFEIYENFSSNNSLIFDRFNESLWTGDDSVTGIGDFGGSNAWENCDFISYGENWDNCFYAYRAEDSWSDVSGAYAFPNDLDLREIGAFYIHVALHTTVGYKGDLANPTVTTGISISDLTTDTDIVSCTQTAQAGGGSLSRDCYYKITGQKIDDDTWNITYFYDIYTGSTSSGNNTATFSVSSLSDSKAHKLVISTGTGGIGTATPPIINYGRIKIINISGVSIKRDNGNNYTNNGSYISEILNYTATDIAKMLLNATEILSNGNINYFLSNDNGTTFEAVTNHETHTFTSTGRTAKLKIEINSSTNLTSPIVTKYRVRVISSTLEGLTIGLGNNVTSMTLGVLNSSTSPVGFNGSEGDINEYLRNSSCVPSDLTCLIPIVFTSDSGGIVQISNLNLTEDVNPISLNHQLSNLEDLSNIELIFNISNKLNMSVLKFDFFGSKNITAIAHTEVYATANDTREIQVKYSKFNISLPYNVDWFEFFARTKDDKNLTPYGQTDTFPIWNVTNQAYEDSFDVFVKVNETYNFTSTNQICNATTSNTCGTGDNLTAAGFFYIDEPMEFTSAQVWFSGGGDTGTIASFFIKDSGNQSNAGTYFFENSVELCADGLGCWTNVTFNGTTKILPAGEWYLWANTSNGDKASMFCTLKNVCSYPGWTKGWNSTRWFDINKPTESESVNKNLSMIFFFHIVERSINPCLTLYISNSSNKSDRFTLNSSYQKTLSNVQVSESNGTWAWIDLDNCTSRFELPWYFFSSICVDCVRSENWFDHVNLLVE